MLIFIFNLSFALKFFYLVTKKNYLSLNFYRLNVRSRKDKVMTKARMIKTRRTEKMMPSRT
jgi:hypothetical protein